MVKISIVISAFNEEKKIGDCLESVKWADEIILVNSGSTDKTAEIAKQYSLKIFNRSNNLMLNVNKNFGFAKATGDWILSLDADERVTPELAKEIKLSIVNHQLPIINGYFIPRKNIIFGKWIKHTGWYPDYQLRLFKNGQGRFPERHVHEMIRLTGEVGYLKEHMIHYNYETISQFLEKLIYIYAPNEAKELIRKGYNLDWRDAIRMPSKEFLIRFFAQEGYKDGFHGLVLSLLMAFYHLVIFVSLWEKQGFKEVASSDFLLETEKEFKTVGKDIDFWFFNEKIKTAKNIFKKNWLRVKKRWKKLQL